MSHTFNQRAIAFFAELQANSYPNASILAALCNCSINTAQRTICRMRDEHLIPIEYCPSSRGYFLTDPSFHFDFTEPVRREELIALAAASSLMWSSGFKCISSYLNRVLNHLSVDTHNCFQPMEKIRQLLPMCRFETTGELDLVGVIDYASAGKELVVRYSCPWNEHPSSTLSATVKEVSPLVGGTAVCFETPGGNRHTIDWTHIESFEKINGAAAANDGECSCWQVQDIELKVDTERFPDDAHTSLHLDPLGNDAQSSVRALSAPITPQLCGTLLTLADSVIEIRNSELSKRVRNRLQQMQRVL